MKKVLIIANLFHASPRIPGLATYLSEHGWHATIVTPPISREEEQRLGFPRSFMEKAAIVEAPYRGDIFWFWRKLFKILRFKLDESITEQLKERVGVTKQHSFIDAMMKWYQTLFAYPDTEKTWKKQAFMTACRILECENYDALMSSSPFPTSHIVASQLKGKYNLPWLADYRDLWTQNHNYSFGNIRKFFEERMELDTLKKVDAMTTVTPPLSARQGIFQKRTVFVIPNGFDPDNMSDGQRLVANRLVMTYTGTIYTGKQDPEKLLKALSAIISNGQINRKALEIKFYGPQLIWFKELIAKYGLEDIVHCYGRIPRAESLRKQKESHVLLLFKWEDTKEEGVYFSKTYEYLSAQRPILAIGGFAEDDINKIFQTTKSGICAITIEDIQAAILGFYDEFSKTGEVSYHVDMTEINKYSYRAMALAFGKILNQIVKI